MQIDITQIIISVLNIIITALIAWAGKEILPKLSKWVEAKMTRAQRENTWNIVVSLVEAAQQLYENNSDKLRYVEDNLVSHGISIDRAMIESAVYEMKSLALNDLRSAVLPEEEKIE